MPETTDFLKLEKPYETENYSVDVFNRNCDKLDASAQFLASSKADTVAVNAALLNKANRFDPSKRDVKGTVLASVIAYPGEVIAYRGVNAPDAPPGQNTFWGKVVSVGQAEYYGLTVYFLRNDGGPIWVRSVINSSWAESQWTPIATATPPQEFDLPLKAGYKKGTYGKNSFFKNQFGEVTINVSINKSDNGAFGTGAFEVAALPIGYYGQTIIASGVIGSNEGKVAACILTVENYGAVKMHNHTEFTGMTTLQGCIKYLA